MGRQKMDKRRISKLLVILTGIIIVGAFPMSIYAETVEDWLKKPTIRESYGDIETEIMAAAMELEQLSLSEDLLLSRLQEAAKKNISAPVLIEGIRTDMDYIRTIVRNLKTRELLPTKEKDALKAVQNALLLLRAGIGEPDFKIALDEASGSKKLKGKQSSILSRAFSALGVTASAQAAYGLSESSRQALVRYLIGSELTERKFDSVMAEIAERIKSGESPEIAVLSLGKAGIRETEKPSQGQEKSKGRENSANETENGPGGIGPSSGSKPEAGPGQNPASNQGGSSSNGTSPAFKPTPGKKNT